MSKGKFKRKLKLFKCIRCGQDILVRATFQKYCEKCHEERKKEIRKKYYDLHPEERKKAYRDYYLENREKCVEYSRKYARKNPEKIKLFGKKWREKNKEHRKKYDSKYRKEHQIKFAFFKCKERAKKLRLPIASKLEFYQWYKNTEKRCYYCDLPLKKLNLSFKVGEEMNLRISSPMKKSKRFQIDRKTPKKGYIINNLVFACPLCNLLKSNHWTSEEWKIISKNFIKPKWKKLDEKFITSKKVSNS